MPKKKRTLTKARREEILHQLGKKPVESDTLATPLAKKVPAQKIVGKPVDHTISIKHNRDTVGELKRVAIATSIVIVLMAATIVANYKTDYLQRAGQVITQKIGF